MTPDIIGAYIYFKKTIRAGWWQFPKVTQVEVKEGAHFKATGHREEHKQTNVELDEKKRTTDELIQAGTCCWHAHVTRKDVKNYAYIYWKTNNGYNDCIQINEISELCLTNANE